MKYWFKAHKFGFGHAYRQAGWVPATAEGWLTILGYLGFMALSVWETYRPQKSQWEMSMHAYLQTSGSGQGPSSATSRNTREARCMSAGLK